MAKSSRTAMPTAIRLEERTLEREFGILGTLVAEWPDELPPALERLIRNAPETFLDGHHQAIALCLKQLSGAALDINVASVLDWLIKNRPDVPSPRELLRDLLTAVEPLAAAECDAEPIWSAFRHRAIRQVGLDISESAAKNPELIDDIISLGIQTLDSIRGDNGSLGELPANSLSSLIKPNGHDPSELLKHRYLCRGGGMLFCGPTGIGKSSLELQCCILWALNHDCFGIHPARAIKSLVVQAENDEGDLAEMRDGVVAGLDLSQEDVNCACNNVFIVREDSLTGPAFFGRLRKLLQSHRPDIVWIDPAFSYLGGSGSDQAVVSAFLRNGLNPIIREFDCGAIVVHHTNKPPTGQEKNGWQAGDFAYLGSGSVEWANWARAVLALRSVGSHDIYELRAAKRGIRLDWRDADNSRVYSRHIAHANEPGVICWRDSVAPSSGNSGGRPKSRDLEELLSLLPPQGLFSSQWVKLAHDELGLSPSTTHRFRRELEQSNRISKSVTSGKWQPVLSSVNQ